MKKILLLSICFIGITTSHLFAQQINKTKLDNYLNYIVKENGDIGEISIFKAGREVYQKSFGQRNIKNLSYDQNTKYHIASISKLFTAALIWQLIEKKQLHLDSKLVHFFPQMPNAKKITIKNLLEHSSGLKDYGLRNGASYYWLRKPVKEAKILKVIREQGVLFQPGDSVSYSNSGYYLLAKIVEMKYHSRYDSILQKHILTPLNLKNTASALGNPKNIFKPFLYNYSTGQWQMVNEDDYKNLIGVGGMVSTPQDLNKFITALFSGKILKKATLEKMKPIVGKEVFGRGLMIAPFYQHIAYGHGGDLTANHAVVTYNPENKIAIAFTINGSRYSKNKFAIDILSIIYGKKYSLPKFYNKNIPINVLEKYVGTYSNQELPQKLTFKVSKGVLKIKNPANGIPYIRLKPLSANKFKVDDFDIILEFQPKTKRLILYQSGMKFILSKTKV